MADFPRYMTKPTVEETTLHLILSVLDDDYSEEMRLASARLADCKIAGSTSLSAEMYRIMLGIPVPVDADLVGGLRIVREAKLQDMIFLFETMENPEKAVGIPVMDEAGLAGRLVMAETEVAALRAELGMQKEIEQAAESLCTSRTVGNEMFIHVLDPSLQSQGWALLEALADLKQYRKSVDTVHRVG
jgi:hypothetical protein